MFYLLSASRKDVKIKLNDATKPENNITNTNLATLLGWLWWLLWETVSSSVSWSESRDSDLNEVKKCVWSSPWLSSEK